MSVRDCDFAHWQLFPDNPSITFRVGIVANSQLENVRFAVVINGTCLGTLPLRPLRSSQDAGQSSSGCDQGDVGANNGSCHCRGYTCFRLRPADSNGVPTSTRLRQYAGGDADSADVRVLFWLRALGVDASGQDLAISDVFPD